MNEIANRIKDSYQWRSGSRFRIDPGIVGARLEQLCEIHGGSVTTEIVADEAVDLNSPLYDLFEHDLEVAVNEYHKAQARAIINNLVIVTVIPAVKKESVIVDNSITIDIKAEDDEEGDEMIVARAYPSVIANGQRFYTPLQAVLHDGVLKDQYLRGIYDELKSLARKASNFKIFGEVVKAIEELPGELVYE